MHFDPNNLVFALCAEGMNLEGEGKTEEAVQLFQQAWNKASTPIEQFTAAHYVARHQSSVADKLHWDQKALLLALQCEDEPAKGTYPSLYLNIAKDYEDLGELDNAKEQYQLALSFTTHLADDGYGKMIKSGIANGLARVSG